VCIASKRLSTALCRSAAQARAGPTELEQIADKSSRAVGDNDHIRLCDPLQARREVRCLADNAALLSLSRSDQVADHHQTSRNTDPGLQ
jgi:hypothetical protein